MQHHPAGAGDCCVHFLALIRIVNAASPQRHALVQNGVQLSLVYHNRATDYFTIPLKAGVYSTARNILIDWWPGIGVASITRLIRDDLVGRVSAIFAGCPGLDDAHKDAYRILLRSKVLLGMDSMHARLLGLLQALDIIATPCDEANNRRVR